MYVSLCLIGKAGILSKTGCGSVRYLIHGICDLSGILIGYLTGPGSLNSCAKHTSHSHSGGALTALLGGGTKAEQTLCVIVDTEDYSYDLAVHPLYSDIHPYAQSRYDGSHCR